MKRAVLGTGLAILGALGVFGPGTLPAHAADATAPDTFTVVSASLQSNMLVVVTDTAAGSTLSGLTSDFQTYSGTSWVDTGYQSSMTKTTGGTTVEPDGSTQDTWDLIIPYSPTSSSSGLAVANGYGISLIPTWADAGVASTVFDQGPFNFTAYSYISLATPSNTSFTYGTAPATLSGTVTITAPGFANDTVDLTRGTVSIVDGADDVISVGGQTSFPVSSTGAFSIPGFTPRASRDYYADYWPGDPAVSAASSGGVGFTVTSVDSSVALTVNPVTETYPKTGTVTGTLKNGSAPLADQSIWVSTSPADATTLASGTTSPNGVFSVAIPAEANGTTLYVGSAASAFVYAATPVAVGLNVVHPTAIDSLTVSLNQYWSLSVKGCLTMSTSPADRSESFTSTAGLELQYLNPAASKPMWKNLQAINAKEALSRCGAGGTWFTTKVLYAPLNAADYRIVYAGTTGATRFASATSSSVAAWRYADRIINAKMTKSGKKLTFSGTLQYYYSGWHNYSGQKMYVDMEPKGSSTWYYIATPVTNSTGNYRVTVTDPVSAHWQMVFEGNNTGVGHLATGTAIVYVAI